MVEKHFCEFEAFEFSNSNGDQNQRDSDIVGELVFCTICGGVFRGEAA